MDFDKSFCRNILNNLPEGVAVCDSEQNIIYINKNFENLTGYSQEFLSGKNISEFVVSSRENCVHLGEGKVCAIGNRPKSYYIGDLKCRNGKSTCIRINSSITKDDKIIYLIIPIEDVAFLDRAHVDFVSTVSHELRTPLTSIKGFAETLLISGGKLNPEQQKKFLSIIKGQVDRLTRLVEDLLSVSKLESKKDKLIYKSIDLQKFFESIVYNIQPKLNNHKIEIKIMPNLPPVWADADKLEQIVTNLLDNAIKYSEEGTKIVIEGKFAKENLDFIKIKVIDRGIGIPEDYLPQIFMKFSRIDNPLTRKAEGTGLGLYITKSLVENMGGKISVESSPQGSVFSITMPVATYEKPTQRKF